MTVAVPRGRSVLTSDEAAAFAAGADAELTGDLAVVAGSCGPGNLHFINGLFDANRNRVPVLAIAMFALVARGRLDAHRRLGRITLPIWLYVSVTGVVIYLMLYRIWPTEAASAVASGTVPRAGRRSASSPCGCRSRSTSRSRPRRRGCA
mgnify:CR=1 FL=1